ncbi:MAG: GntR family transcriptional regulator [Acidobacteriaceae bacterium]
MKRRPPLAAPEFAFRLDAHSGVPVYRQLIDQVLGAMATGILRTADQLPTVRQVAVDLAINPNTVMRAYREMEIRDILDTQQGAGTFIAEQKEPVPKQERERQLAQLTGEFVSRAGLLGLTVEELMHALRDRSQERDGRRAESRRKS